MKTIKLIIFLSIFAWCTGFFYFLSYTKNINNTNRNITQAIIIYGGNKERLYVGTKLLKLGYAPVVYITGYKPESEYSDFIKINNLAPEQFIFNKFFPSNNLTPLEDTLSFMKKFQLHTTRVVINATQLPRARIDFKTKAPNEVELIPHVVSIKEEKDFKVFIEYLKFSITLIASFVGMKNEFNLSYP